MAAQADASGRFRWLAIATCVATYALVVVGAIVRVTGSGDACPDWPRCHGELLPPLQTHVLIEFSHRLVASADSLLVLALVVAAWRTRQNAVVRWGALAAVGLVIVQIALGGATVLTDLSANMVMAHLAVAAAFFATLLAVALFSFPNAVQPTAERRADAVSFRNLAALAALATLALMLTGSYVSGTGAGLAFRDWPLFDGRLLPDGSRLAVIHFTHRLAALLVGLLLLYVAQRAWRQQSWSRTVALGGAVVVALYIAQVLVGAANVWTALQPAAAGAHVALAVALWGTMVALSVLAHRAAEPELAAVPQTVRAPVEAARATPAQAEPAPLRGRS